MVGELQYPLQFWQQLDVFLTWLRLLLLAMLSSLASLFSRLCGAVTCRYYYCCYYRFFLLLLFLRSRFRGCHPRRWHPSVLNF